MAQQTINIGTTANDGTGDPLRTAFDKTNDNFNELYAGAGVADNSVDASKLDVSGNGTSGQALLSDGDGTFSWGQAGETYTAGTGITLTGTEFSIGQSVGTSDIVQFGEVRSTGDVIAYYSSDKRLKDNIKPIENALDKIESIGGYTYEWNDNQSTYQGSDIGVIAQEIEAIAPELVIDRETGYKAVKYEKLVAILIEGIKELSAKVTELENKL
jgi:hypothetical protein